jgi:hypothetical protein
MVTLRKPQASPPSAASRLEAVQVAIEASSRRLTELSEQRSQCLLKDNDAEAIQLQTQIDTLNLEIRVHRDKAQLLAEAVREEERIRDAEQRQARIEQVEKMARERSAFVAQFTAGISKADKAMRSLIATGRSLQAAHSFLPHDALACLLMPSTIVAVLQHEMFRLGGKARLYGGQDSPHVDITTFPGARPPRLELSGMPEQTKPLASVLAEANDLLSRILRTGKGSAVEVVQQQVDSAPEPPPPANGNAVLLTTAQERLANALKKQSALSEDPACESNISTRWLRLRWHRPRLTPRSDWRHRNDRSVCN